MAASLGNAVGAIGGYSKWREGRKMQKEAQRKINAFKWEDLQNPYKDLQVSTMGADLQREETARAGATAVEALRGAGARGLAAGTANVMESTINMNRQSAADLDQQRKQIDFAAAADDAQVRGMTENRQANELAGYGQMLNIGRQEKYGGVADMMNAGQAQGQTNMQIMQMVMGGMGGGGGGGGAAGGMGGMMGGKK